MKYGKKFDWDTKGELLESTAINVTTFGATTVLIMGTTALESVKIVIKRLKLPITPEEFNKLLDVEYEKVFPMVNFLPGVERLLQHLKRHSVPMAICSSSKKTSFDLKTSHFGDKFKPGAMYFNHVVLASNDGEIKRSKPFPDSFLVCKSRFRPEPDADKCLVFEDSVSGVLAGCRAGMQTVWIPDDKLDKDQQQDHKKKNPDLRPVLILKSMLDFKPELFGLPPFSSE